MAPKIANELFECVWPLAFKGLGKSDEIMLKTFECAIH